MLVAAALVVTVLITRDDGGPDSTDSAGSAGSAGSGASQTTQVGAVAVVPSVVDVGTLPVAPITVAPSTPAATAVGVTVAPSIAAETSSTPNSPAVAGQLPSTTWNGEYTPAPPTEPLFIGHTGGRVRQLQEALIDGGFLTGAADGEFGPGTERAVVAFQQQVGLPADGIAGDDTRAALGLA